MNPRTVHRHDRAAGELLISVAVVTVAFSVTLAATLPPPAQLLALAGVLALGAMWIRRAWRRYAIVQQRFVNEWMADQHAAQMRRMGGDR